ncbi:MAG TPA: hypothetical protein VI522_04700 [Gammaproteobacteria bacterium]|nr:hypothetical protein [Gammaproteobacteria bacterium]
MSELILQPTATAQWQALVHDALTSCGGSMHQDLESYLVMMLKRFSKRPEIVSSVMALEFLQGVEASGGVRHDLLRDLGDKCLIFSGFFPDRAQRKRVPVSYFAKVGQGAYAYLAVHAHESTSFTELFTALQEHFVYLMDIIYCIRELRGNADALTLEQAEELWSVMGSRHALKVIRRYSNGFVARDRSGFVH